MEQRIEEYIRFKLMKFINSAKDKNICSKCKQDKNLQVHHEDGYLFDEILIRAHDMLDISKRKFSSDYSGLELEVLYTVVLGLHKQNKLKVVCKNCHKEEHMKDSKNIIIYMKFKKKYKDRIAQAKKDGIIFQDIDIFKQEYNNFYLSRILKKYLNKKLFENDTKSLSDDICKEIFIDEKRSLGSKAINDILKNCGIINFKISSREEKIRNENRGKRYWLIEEILDD